MSYKPKIVIFHDVITDEEIQYILKLSQQKVRNLGFNLLYLSCCLFELPSFFFSSFFLTHAHADKHIHTHACTHAHARTH